jgi:hypothetical protein
MHAEASFHDGRGFNLRSRRTQNDRERRFAHGREGAKVGVYRWDARAAGESTAHTGASVAGRTDAVLAVRVVIAGVLLGGE